MSGPKVQNLFDKYIKPLNSQLVGQSAKKVINYYDDAYGNTTQVSVLTSSKLEERFRSLQLTHKQEESLRYQFSTLGRLGQVLFDKKFAQVNSAAAQQ